MDDNYEQRNSLPDSARRALTQFGLGYGDALLIYEYDALLDISNGKVYELVVTISTILKEPKVVIVDKNVDESERKIVRAFVEKDTHSASRVSSEFTSRRTTIRAHAGNFVFIGIGAGFLTVFVIISKSS